jgi:threonine/homoserine/homoserine lactone efflux protein
MGIAWLVAVALTVDRARALLDRRRTRQTLERTTGAALLGFGVAVAVDAAR